MATSSGPRSVLVRQLEKRGLIKSPSVRRAFLAVPREAFVGDHLRRGGLEAVYKDVPLVTKTDAKGGAVSSSSQPAIMAIMLEALRLERGHRVLEVGAGTGYNAALLSHIVGARGEVTAIDIDPDLVARAKIALRGIAANVGVFAGDGRAGHRARAPYDRIIVTASTDSIPKAWYEQLAVGGLLQVPFRLLDRDSTNIQSIVVFERTGSGLRSVNANPGGFMGMRDSADEEAPLVRGSRSVYAIENNGVTQHVHGYLTGAALSRAGRDGRRHLLRTLLTEPRSSDIAPASKGNALQTFLAFCLPRASLVSYIGSGVAGLGVVNDTFDGVAAAVRGPRGKTTLRCYGARSAERTLTQALAGWRELGSPGDRDLELSVSFDRAPPAWRTLTRGDAHIAIAWRQG